MSSFTIGVIDTSCQEVDQSFFVPLVAMVTASTTKVGVLVGFDEYIPSNPPKKYRTLTWSGTSEQQLWQVGGSQVGGAQFDYSGFSSVDLKGNYTSLYSKNFNAMCNSSSGLVNLILNPPSGGLQAYEFRGWFGPPQNQKCPSPSLNPYSFVDNEAVGKGDEALNDFSRLWGSKQVSSGAQQISNFSVTSSTTGSCADSGQSPNLVGLVNPIPDGSPLPPINNGNEGTVWFGAYIVWNHNYSSQLSGEMTESEAMSVATVTRGNGSTSSYVRNGFTITQTTVNFTLNCSQLIVGQAYLLKYDLWDTTSNTHTIVQVGFVADATTHSVSGALGVPSLGHSVVIRNPTITFST